MAFLEGFNQAFFPVLLQHLDEQRKRKQQEERFGQLQTDTNETVWKPQGETVYGQPEGALGVRYPTQLPVPQRVSQQIPLDDPRILQALMNFRAGGGEQQDVSNYLNFRQMGLPQYKTTEGAQGQLLEQEQERLTGRTKNVRELTPPIFNRNVSGGVERENPNQWLADSMNPSVSPQGQQLAKQKYDTYVKNQGTIAGVRTEASRPFALQDRQIKSYVGKDNLTRIIWQKPDGQTYETLSQDESATTDARNRAVSLSKIDPVMSAISELSEKINTGKGLIAKLSGGVERAKAEGNLNDDVAEYQALIAGFTPLVARAVGHTGVLTEQDVQSVKELFPKPGDSKTLRDRKIERVKSILGALQTRAGQGGQTSGVPDDADFDKMTDEQLQEYINKK